MIVTVVVVVVVVAFLTISCVGGATDKSQSQVMQLHLFNLTRFPFATCNDGSASGFYYLPSPTSTTWIIHQQGGGWCYNATTCAERPSVLRSSKGWSSVMPVPSDGVLNATGSPSLLTAHKVYLAYCTSDAYIGNVSASVEFGFEWQFRGRAVVHALFETLLTEYSMAASANTQIFYSGCSAGARGALFNADFILDSIIKPRFGVTISRYGVLLDSAMWVQTPSVPGATPFPLQAQLLFNAASLGSTIDPNCLATMMPWEVNGWKCIFAQFALPFVRSPYLLHAYLYDEFQISGDLNIPFVQWPIHTSSQLAFSEEFRQISANVSRSLIGQHDGQSGLLPACYAHCATEDAKWHRVSVGGVSLGRAVAMWWSSLSQLQLIPGSLHHDGPLDGDDRDNLVPSDGSSSSGGGVSPFLIIDNCTGLSCGDGCPHR